MELIKVMAIIRPIKNYLRPSLVKNSTPFPQNLYLHLAKFTQEWKDIQLLVLSEKLLREGMSIF